MNRCISPAVSSFDLSPPWFGSDFIETPVRKELQGHFSKCPQFPHAPTFEVMPLSVFPRLSLYNVPKICVSILCYHCNRSYCYASDKYKFEFPIDSPFMKPEWKGGTGRSLGDSFPSIKHICVEARYTQASRKLYIMEILNGVTKMMCQTSLAMGMKFPADPSLVFGLRLQSMYSGPFSLPDFVAYCLEEAKTLYYVIRL